MTSDSHSDCLKSDTCSSAGEIMLFGFRVKVDPLRKTVSMNDLSQYVQAQPASDSSGNCNNHESVAAGVGYASADDAARHQSNGGRERKRGVPWTEDEHKLFLLGLQQVGKGDWRGISRKFVKTRTPTQVASHAQKYFLRRSNLNRRRRRSSLFDITTDSVADIEKTNSQPIQPPMDAIPATVDPAPSQLPCKTQLETVTFSYCDRFNSGPSREYDYLDEKHERNTLSLSLSLGLFPSSDHNRTDSSAYQAITRYDNKDRLISVG